MSRSRPTLSPEVLALLERERNLSSLPATVRGRALVRARAALVAGVSGVHLRAAPAPAASSRWAAAAAAGCILSMGLGAAAYEVRARLALWSSDGRAATAAPAASVEKVVAPPSPSIVPAPPRSSPARAIGTLAAPYASAAGAELRLLRRARAAVAREDYEEALQPIAQHSRRFQSGRLVEEREALRIKALAGLGRTAEARRAAAMFCARFPRSVLLQAVNQLSTTEP